MARKLRPHSVLAILPPLTRTELEVAVERVRLYGQRTPIEIVDGMVVAGWEEYQACVAAGVTPKTVTIKAPPCLVEYVIRRLPRNLTRLDRACIAVLAEKEWKKLGRERMREAGRLGGRVKGRVEMARPFGHERWFETAARIVGTTAGAVKRVAALRRTAPDVFEAVRARKVVVLRDAQDIAAALPTPRARAKVFKLREEQPKAPISRLVADVMRTIRPPLRSSEPSRGAHWAVFEGHLQREGTRIPSGSIDLVHADIVYQDSEMAEAVAKLAARVLVPGGILAMIAGTNIHGAMNALAKHLDPIAVGAYFLRGNGRAKWAGAVTKLDVLPVLFFASGKRTRWPIAHLGFTSESKEKTWHGWSKNTQATQDIILSCVPAGSRVLDPCCGGGTTGEAALRAGCEFVGIDIAPDAVKATRARLAAVEKELGAERSRGAVLRRVV